ncbi:MAG: hypothetical protein AB8G05_24820 [Oligoflexales bacterium]
MSILVKIRRIKPLIRAKKAIVDKEMLNLTQIIQEKIATQNELHRCQQAYMQGINELNQQRNREYRNGQDYMEKCVDHTKDLWTNLFKESQILEKKIEAQRSVLLKAKRRLKEAENLHERYEYELKKLVSKQEQNFLDEFHLGTRMRQK